MRQRRERKGAWFHMIRFRLSTDLSAVPQSAAKKHVQSLQSSWWFSTQLMVRGTTSFSQWVLEMFVFDFARFLSSTIFWDRKGRRIDRQNCDKPTLSKNFVPQDTSYLQMLIPPPIDPTRYWQQHASPWMIQCVVQTCKLRLAGDKDYQWPSRYIQMTPTQQVQHGQTVSNWPKALSYQSNEMSTEECPPYFCIDSMHETRNVLAKMTKVYQVSWSRRYGAIGW